MQVGVALKARELTNAPPRGESSRVESCRFRRQTFVQALRVRHQPGFRNVAPLEGRVARGGREAAPARNSCSSMNWRVWSLCMLGTRALRSSRRGLAAAAESRGQAIAAFIVG